MISELSVDTIRPLVEFLGGGEFEVLQDPDVMAFRSPFGQVILVYLYEDAPPFTALHALAVWSKAFEEDRRGEALLLLNA
jgi:hypothetical protein